MPLRRVEPAKVGGRVEQLCAPLARYNSAPASPGVMAPATCSGQESRRGRIVVVDRHRIVGRLGRDAGGEIRFRGGERSRSRCVGAGERGGYQTVLERESEQPASSQITIARSRIARASLLECVPHPSGGSMPGQETAPSWDRHDKYSRQLPQRPPERSGPPQILYLLRPAAWHRRQSLSRGKLCGRVAGVERQRAPSCQTCWGLGQPRPQPPYGTGQRNLPLSRKATICWTECSLLRWTASAVLKALWGVRMQSSRSASASVAATSRSLVGVPRAKRVASFDFVVEHVEADAREVARFECRQQRRRRTQLAARDVDEHRARLDAPPLGRVEVAEVLAVEVHRRDQHVGLRQGGGDVGVFDVGVAGIDVDAEHAHAECLADLADFVPDVADADDHQRAARALAAGDAVAVKCAKLLDLPRQPAQAGPSTAASLARRPRGGNRAAGNRARAAISRRRHRRRDGRSRCSARGSRRAARPRRAEFAIACESRSAERAARRGRILESSRPCSRRRCLPAAGSAKRRLLLETLRRNTRRACGRLCPTKQFGQVGSECCFGTLPTQPPTASL